MGRQVLIVDDTKNIRLMLTKCLELDGYQVDSAGNGREALDAILSGTYDLIFLDIKLPEISGTEVLRRIRSGRSSDSCDRNYGLSHHQKCSGVYPTGCGVLFTKAVYGGAFEEFDVRPGLGEEWKAPSESGPGSRRMRGAGRPDPGAKSAEYGSGRRPRQCRYL